MRRRTGPGATAPDPTAPQQAERVYSRDVDPEQRMGLLDGMLQEAARIAAQMGATREEWAAALHREIQR
jgi:hypothetical protein